MEIRKAAAGDLDAIERSYQELLSGKEPNASGWVLGVYPTRAWAEENLENLYVLTEGETLGASMIFNQVQPEDYQKVPWAYPAQDGAVWVIHTLCVPPGQAGRGYGRTMVEYALEAGKRLDGVVLRLDTFAGNEPAKKLYQRCGFRLAGRMEVLHQGLIPEELVFFEIRLGNPA